MIDQMNISEVFAKRLTSRVSAVHFLHALSVQGKDYHFDDGVDDCLSHLGAMERSIIEARVIDCRKLLGDDGIWVAPLMHSYLSVDSGATQEDCEHHFEEYLGQMSDLIAYMFAAIVQRELADDLPEIISRNKVLAEKYDGLTCATHDFCDANMLMLDAFEHFGLSPMGSVDGVEGWRVELMHRLWGAAWGKAVAAEFAIKQLA